MRCSNPLKPVSATPVPEFGYPYNIIPSCAIFCSIAWDVLRWLNVLSLCSQTGKKEIPSSPKIMTADIVILKCLLLKQAREEAGRTQEEIAGIPGNIANRKPC